MTDTIHWNPLVPEVTVINFRRSLELYTKMLGFTVLYSRTDPNFAYLDQEMVQFMLEEYHPNGWYTGTLEAPLGRGINFQIALLDIQPLYDRLRKANYPMFQDIQDQWYQTGQRRVGQREFLIQDPDGYLLRFCQALGERHNDS